MTDYLKSKWEQASGRIKIALLLLLSALGLSVVFALASGALDSDSDGTSDSYEQFFGLDYTNAADALLNYDADILLNIQESDAGVDPFRKDTDADAWADGIDQTISRAFLNFEPRFIYGDHYLYPMPPYIKAVYKTGLSAVPNTAQAGGLFTNGAWRVAESGKGKALTASRFPLPSLVIELDRSLLTNNLLLEIELIKHRSSGLYIDLANTQGVVVAQNLCGNLSGGNGERDRLLLELPLEDYPQARKIVLRCSKGEATVFEMLAYIDRDIDALDSEQEAQIGSADLPVSGRNQDDEDDESDDDDDEEDDDDGDKEGAENRPKIVLDLVFDFSDPFSPALGALRLFGEYRILPTDALFSEAVRLRNMEGRLPRRPPEPSSKFQFYIRQAIAVLDASSNVVRSLVSDFSISPSNIWFPGHYAHVGTETAWNGKGVGEALLPDGAYRYRITGTYLRVKANAKGEEKEKLIAVSSPLEGTVLLDAGPPVTEATVTPAANAHGWHKDDVTVQLTATDNLSGAAATYYTINGGATKSGASILLAEEGAYTVSYWSVDMAGNTESAKSITIRIDKTAPEISVTSRLPAANNWGWNNSPVTVTYSVSDALSGVDVAAASYEPDIVSAEGADQSVAGSVMDLAGNTASITLSGINIDLTPPEITSAITGTQGSNNWWVSQVAVSYTVSDALSGTDPLLGDHAADILGEGGNQTAEGDVYDKAGNHASAQVTDINVDWTPPTISAAITPPANQHGWHNTNPTIMFFAEDQIGLSGMAYVSPGVTVSYEGAGHRITGIARDVAGNVSQTTVTINLDKTSPEITVASRTPANEYGWNNTPVTVMYAASDALSGVNVAVGGYEPDTILTEGSDQSVSGSVADLAGNTFVVTADNIKIDFTPPEILSFSPEDGEVVADPLQPIAIVFHEDISGIDAGSLALALDGSNVTTEATLTATRITYQVLQEFQEGSHTVAVSLADSAGNSASGQITFEADTDGLPNAWELLHFGTLDPRPEEDADADSLSNLTEYQADIDPTDADTDNDGFRDSADVVPISRAVFHWGEPRFVAGDELLGFFPDWVFRAWKEGGEWESWHVSATNEEGYGALFIYLDRNIITNDAIMKIDFVDHSGSSLFIDILYQEITTNWQGFTTTNHLEVATNLYGNIIDGSGILVRKTFDIPLVANPAVDTIRLRRGVGEITISNTVIYVDQDRDGLDLLQEQALDTSDQNTDSDSDGLGDFAEITMHGTSPANPDSDFDGIRDGTELQFGNNPASSNAYSVLPFIERFETNTVVVGDLNGQNNWTASPSNTAFVQTNTVYADAQALEIAAPTDQWCEVRQMLASSATNVVWVDLYVRVIPSTAPTDRVDRSAEMYFDEQGRLVVYDGKQQPGSAWVTLTNHTSVVTGTWARISIKMDYGRQEWLVCLNDYVVADGLGFATQRNEFVAMGIEAQEAFADNVAISTNVPEGVSADWDTLPDAWELQYFGNLAQTDTGDPDADGLANLEELQKGTNPNNPDTDLDELPDGWETQYGFDPRGGLSFSTNLVGWWRFEEDLWLWPVVFDGSGYGNHGVATNMGLWPNIVPGYPSGWALEFDGVDDEVVVPHDDTLMPTSAITISAWLNPDPALAAEHFVITKGYSYHLYVGSDSASLYVNGEAGNWSMAYVEFPTGNWVHIAAVYDGTNAGIYADGVVGSNAGEGAGPLLSNETDVVIGGWAGYQYAKYDGLIADIRIYNTALSAQAVRSLGESGTDSDGDGLNNLEEFRHNTNPANPDTDGDGAHDGREVNAGFDPLDPASLPTSISGAVAYSGKQLGVIRIVASPVEGVWTSSWEAVLETAGVYTVWNMTPYTNYWLKAYKDLDGNDAHEDWEASGAYTGNPVYVAGHVFEIDVALSDPDGDSDGLPDWWERQYWGGISPAGTNDYDNDGLNNPNEYLYGTDPTRTDTDGDGLTDGVEVNVHGTNPLSSDTDGDGFQDDREVETGTEPLDASSFPVSISGNVIYELGPQTGRIVIVACDKSNGWSGAWNVNVPYPIVDPLPHPYTISNVPNSDGYWVKAYMESSGNVTDDFWEAKGEYDGNPIVPVNDISGIDITLHDPDTDNDGLADWWELFWFDDLAQYGFMDPDHDRLTNDEEENRFTDPYGDLWAEGRSVRSATVRWNMPRVSGISYYSYSYYSINIDDWRSELITNVTRYGDSATTRVTLNAVEGALFYKIELRGHDAQGTVLWEKEQWWEQFAFSEAERDLSSWYLFPPVPRQALSNAPAGTVIMSEEVTTDCYGEWDVFYVSGADFAYESNSFVGVHLEYDLPAGAEVKARSFRTHQTGSCSLRFKVVSDGTGWIEIRKPIHLQRWRPGIKVGF